MLQEAQLNDLLKNWVRLNKEVMNLSEEDLVALLAQEKLTRARLRTMLRIYNRYSKIRSIREKKALAVGAKG